MLALYAPEEISSQAAELASLQNGQIHSSAILEFEMTFAVHAKEVRGEIPSGSSGRVLSQFQTDLQQGRFLLVPLGIDIKSCTKDIAARSVQAKRPVFLRTLDGIHIATALEMGSSELITADRKMADAATRLGIKIKFLKKSPPGSFSAFKPSIPAPDLKSPLFATLSNPSLTFLYLEDECCFESIFPRCGGLHLHGGIVELEDLKKSCNNREVNFPAASYVDQLASAFSQVEVAVCNRLAASLNAARERKANIFLCGNGGSAANANHWANDLIYGAGKTGRGGVRAHSLAANTSVIMCLANDTGYENVFSGQLRVLASPGDILIAMSGSGNSPNILRALEEAKNLGLETWAIVGYDGGKALQLAPNVIHFPINDMQIAEDLQMVVCHEVTKILATPV